jgi:L-histidine Nalpha-methyltransferase
VRAEKYIPQGVREFRTKLLEKGYRRGKWQSDARGELFEIREGALIEDFREDIIRTLSASRPWISGRHCYKGSGSDAFEITNQSPHYYPFYKEAEIIQVHAQRISRFLADGEASSLLELGIGFGSKTKLLLRALADQSDLKAPAPGHFIPTDIDIHPLRIVLPELLAIDNRFCVTALQENYLDTLRLIVTLWSAEDSLHVLFLGGSIAGFPPAARRHFLGQIQSVLGPVGILAFGADLRPHATKSVDIIESAYNDIEAPGSWARMKLAPIGRMRDELGVDIEPADFEYRGEYNFDEHEIESNLIARKDITISLDEHVIRIPRETRIKVGFNYRFDIDLLHGELHDVGFEVKQILLDSQNYYSFWLVGSRQ